MPDRRLARRVGFALRPRHRPEPVDVPEDPIRDRRLDQLVAVHDLRLRHLEQERQEARNAWRQARLALRQHKQCWRLAVDTAQSYWQRARAGFMKMVITSGQFRHAKAVYERLKLEAAQMRLVAAEAVPVCRHAGQRFFDSRRRLAQERLHIEKLQIVRDELAQ